LSPKLFYVTLITIWVFYREGGNEDGI